LVGLLTGAEKWRSRLGLISVPPRGTANEGSRANKRVWVHASSVGEVRAAARLVKEICKDPATEVVFSTMTAAGNQVARKSVEGPSAFFFLPLDVPYIVGRALKLIQPDTIVLVETELWPYLVFEANRQGIKVVVVNSRVSDRSLRRYALFGFLFREVFGRVHAVMAQNERNALRFRSLGTPPERITVTGNTKQDAEPANVASLGLRRKMGWAPGDVVVTAGSTRPNEEAALCEGFANAKASAPHLRLVLAPRHLGRVDYVSKIVSLRGLTQVRWSRLDSEAAPGESKADVLVLDTIGDLLAAYRESDVAFVGGTLSGHGGHNVLEPAAAGLAMLAGPSRENIEDDANALIERGALKVVDSSRQVAEELTRLAEFREERERSSREALEFYRSRPVASAITLECLRKFGVV
jgi:3-deoxy-D-manno-octulosonic-acid transferase